MARLLSLQKVSSRPAIDGDEVPAATGLPTRPLDLQNREVVASWCNHYGISEEALRTAALAVGPMPAALIAYFASRGASTRKVVTPEMRAARLCHKRGNEQSTAAGSDLSSGASEHASDRRIPATDRAKRGVVPGPAENEVHNAS